MKKFLFLFCFLAILLCPLIMVGCSDKESPNNNNPPITENPIQLTQPDPVWKNNLVCWDKIDNATSYLITVNDQEFSTAENFYELAIDNIPQTYNIKVKAIGDNKSYLNSNYSDILTLQSKQLSTPGIYNGDHTFWVNSDHSSGTIEFTSFENTDFIKLYVNEDIYTYEKTDVVVISSNMCKAGKNTIKIQACSNNKLYLDSEFLTDVVYKEETPTQVRVENGNIVWGFPSITYNVKYDGLGYGNISVPVINYGYMQSLNSDPVYIDVYRIKPLDAYKVDYVYSSQQYIYECFTTLKNDLNADTSDGSDYNKLEIVVYTNQEQKYTFDLNTAQIYKTITFSVPALFHIEKVTFKLYNSEHPEYVCSITTIYENMLNQLN